MNQRQPIHQSNCCPILAFALDSLLAEVRVCF